MSGPSRRAFLTGGCGAVAITVAGCGKDDPSLDEPLALGTVDEVRGLIESAGGAHHVPSASAYLVAVPDEHRDALAAAWDERLRPGIEAGFVALHQNCPHQGCRVPFCTQSGWFECPCHGSRYSPVGERRRGPAGRGMDALVLEVFGDSLSVTGAKVDGLGKDIDITKAAAAGPHCV